MKTYLPHPPDFFPQKTVSFPRFWSGCSRFTKRLKACRRALREDPASASSRWTFSKISAAGLPGGASCSRGRCLFSKLDEETMIFLDGQGTCKLNATANYSSCDGLLI